MEKKLTKEVNKSARKPYHAPVLKRLGEVKKLTLKTGSQTDGFAAGRV